MRAYLKEFFDLFDYDEAVRTVLLDAYDRVVAERQSGEDFSALLRAYEQSVEQNYAAMIEQMSKISHACVVHAYTGHALLFICLSRHLRACYRQRGLDEDIWRGSMLDIKYKIEECRLVKGIVGTFVASWYDRFFNITRFALGRLQFEIIPFGREVELGGVKLTPQTPVINVHIPRTGTPLDLGAVQASYRQAAEFFRPWLGAGTPVAFVCHTWLFFEKHRTMLPPTSNIRRFMDDYVMAASGEYDDYSQLWRLFDCEYTGDVEALPADSTLRRAYIDLIRRGEKTGFGAGLYLYQV